MDKRKMTQTYYVGNLKPGEDCTLILKPRGLTKLRLRMWLGRKLIMWGCLMLGIKFSEEE